MGKASPRREMLAAPRPSCTHYKDIGRKRRKAGTDTVPARRYREYHNYGTGSTTTMVRGVPQLWYGEYHNVGTGSTITWVRAVPSAWYWEYQAHGTGSIKRMVLGVSSAWYWEYQAHGTGSIKRMVLGVSSARYGKQPAEGAGRRVRGQRHIPKGRPRACQRRNNATQAAATHRLSRPAGRNRAAKPASGT